MSSLRVCIAFVTLLAPHSLQAASIVYESDLRIISIVARTCDDYDCWYSDGYWVPTGSDFAHWEQLAEGWGYSAWHESTLTESSMVSSSRSGGVWGFYQSVSISPLFRIVFSVTEDTGYSLRGDGPIRLEEYPDSAALFGSSIGTFDTAGVLTAGRSYFIESYGTAEMHFGLTEAVPEPSTFSLLALGLALIGRRRPR